MPLQADEIETFKRQGFVVVPGFFESAEMSALSSWLDEMRDKAPGEGEEARFYERSSLTGENMLVRVENVFGGLNPGPRELMISSKTSSCLAQLFGEEPLLFKEKINYKMSGCRPDKLHQDQAAGWNSYCDFFITMGIVVDPNRLDNAALSFMTSGNYQKGLMNNEWMPLTEDDPPYEPQDEYALLEADPGDVVFFDCYVPHGSPANTSYRARRNIFLTFNKASDGDMRDAYYADKAETYPPNEAEDAREEASYRV